jgi:hypothetical protein
MNKPNMDKGNLNPSRKAILRSNNKDSLYLNNLVDHLNHLGYDFGCVSSIISSTAESSTYLVSLPDLFYLVDRINESLGMPKKPLEVPDQGVLFTDDAL